MLEKELVKNKVHEMRLAKEVRQEDLAQAIGVTRQTIIAVEKGNYTPSVLLAMKIAKYFKKQIEEIFYV